METSGKAPTEAVAVGPKEERMALPKLAQIALREIGKTAEAAMNEVVAESYGVLGIRAAEGWQFDARAMSFVRQV